MPRMIGLLVVGAVVMLGLAACDDGDDFDEAAYCEVAREFEEIEELPTNEQLDRYVAAAPDEIKDDADFVANLIKEAEGNLGALFGDGEIENEFAERIERIEAAETERCGIEHGGDENGGERDEEDDSEPAEGAAVVEITGVEYAFEGVPAELAAGLIAFGFTNVGEEAHEMGVFELSEGVTPEEALAFEGDPEEAGLVSEVGFVYGDPGGEAAYVNAELEAGTYGMVCLIPGPEGRSHAELGMIAEFTVT